MYKGAQGGGLYKGPLIASAGDTVTRFALRSLPHHAIIQVFLSVFVFDQLFVLVFLSP